LKPTLKVEPAEPAIPAELEGLAEEAKKYESAEEFVEKSIKTEGTKVYTPINETKDTIMLLKIDALPQGTGAGTKIINGLKAYADNTGKKLIIPDIKNPEFFDKFSWLKPDFTTKYSNTRSYIPVSTQATAKPTATIEGKAEVGEERIIKESTVNGFFL